MALLHALRWCVIVGCVAAPVAAQVGSLVITRSRAGAITLGMPQDSVRQLVDREHLMELTTCTEKACLPALGILRGTEIERPVVAHLTEPGCGTVRVAWIEVFDPAYRTREGVGVGTSRAVLERTYRTTVRANDRSELYAPAPGLWFRLARAGGTREVRVEAVIVRDSASIPPTALRCTARTPPDRH
jgi:hypothetical protein